MLDAYALACVFTRVWMEGRIAYLDAMAHVWMGRSRNVKCYGNLGAHMCVNVRVWWGQASLLFITF